MMSVVEERGQICKRHGPKSGCRYVDVILHSLYKADFTFTLSCIYQHPQCLYVHGVALASALVEHIVNNGHNIFLD